ncbi:hypothetical protein ACIBI3_44830 [Actinomadura luteofluorescens]|uniref:hypothetical protein n=1 Tax=Actinomadura luteofluorescens TaxID=46163 RepID=UPI0034802DEA
MGIIAWIILGPVAGVIVHLDHRRRRIGTPPARLPFITTRRAGHGGGRRNGRRSGRSNSWAGRR